jgi:non-specific serine/threonine protein kinase
MVPEILRRKAQILERQGARNLPMSKNLLKQAMQQSSVQNGLYWQLSAAISLVEFCREDVEKRDARRTLLQIYDKFGEGLSRPRLLRARMLLNEAR